MAILEYAALHSFDIVRTYSDTAKSGHPRAASRCLQLLQDVVAGTAPYRAILVYECELVRGRFQDTDESAHYEFLCKSAGVPVHYCAETFANDGYPSEPDHESSEADKWRANFAESGVKVLAGQKAVGKPWI